jgi:VWFA-related protein
MLRDVCPAVSGLIALLLPPGAYLLSAGQEFKISDNVDYVLLDVSVRDPHGSFVTGLEKSNFQVFEDGYPREITYFAAKDAPVAVGLVVDNSGSMATKRARVVTAGLAFARQSNPKDEFFVVNFNDWVTFGLPRPVAFTDDLQLLRKALYYGEPQGRTALYDAISAAVKHLELSKHQRRTLIIVSDGRDNASRIRLDDVLKELQASRATIYTIGLKDELEDTDMNSRVLRKIAQLTGGDYFEPIDTADVISVFAQIASDMRHRYLVEYAPDEIHIKNPVRSVKVIVHQNGRRLKARTRTTYSVARAGE